MQMALAKQLSQRISESDMQGNWGKVKSGSKKKVVSKLYTLSLEQQAQVAAATAAQIISEMMEAWADNKLLIEASRKFAGVLARIAEVDKESGALRSLNHPTALPPEDEWEDAGPEKELNDETGEEFAPGFFNVEPMPTLQIVTEDEPEDEEEQVDFDIPEMTPEIMEKMRENMRQHENDEPGDEDDFPVPEMTPEIMLRMFENMRANGYL